VRDFRGGGSDLRGAMQWDSTPAKGSIEASKQRMKFTAGIKDYARAEEGT